MAINKKFTKLICPICNCENFKELDDILPAYLCESCSLGIEQHITEDPFGQYQPTAYDADRENGNGVNRWSRFHHDCAVTASRIIQLSKPSLLERAHHGLWIDVGANNGATLVTARRLGWRPFAIEATSEACTQLYDLFGITGTTYGGWVSGQVSLRESAHVVSLFDVLEHLMDMPGAILAAAATLAQSGILIIEVPDFDEVAVNSFKIWKHRRISADGKYVEHQYHLNEKSLTKLIETYAPSLKIKHVAHPVPGKLQMVFRRDV